MKTNLSICFVIFSTLLSFAQNSKNIVLNQPDLNRGMSVMQSLAKRASVTEFDTKELELQDLSDLLWAANGINRPEEGKRTAASAMNAQDVDVYVFTKEAAYLYDAKVNSLVFVTAGDHRSAVAGQQEFVAKAPVICLLVSDISRFRTGNEQQKLDWANIDTGIVSQNIALFCTSAGLVTRPRVSMDVEKLREVLQLKESQHIVLNHPVSYPVE